MVRWRARWTGGLAALLLMTACGATPAPAAVDEPVAPVQLRAAVLAAPAACSAGFVPHALEHTTRSGARVATAIEVELPGGCTIVNRQCSISESTDEFLEFISGLGGIDEIRSDHRVERQ